MFEDRKNQSNQDLKELGVLPLRNLVLFPGTLLAVEVGRKGSLQLLSATVRNNPPVLLIGTQKDAQVDEPGAEDLHPIGVEAEVLKIIQLGGERVNAVLRGLSRRRLEVRRSEPYLSGVGHPLVEVEDASTETAALLLAVREALAKLAEHVPEIGRHVIPALNQDQPALRQPGPLSDLVAAYLNISAPEKLALISELDVKARLHAVLGHVQRQIEVLEVKERIDQHVREDLGQKQREAVLRQQMKAIQEELGEGQDKEDLDPFEERIRAAGMPEEVEKVARKQLQRLKSVSDGSPEYGVQRNYLEWLCDLPWSRRTEDKTNLAAARAVLDADHDGLEKVKKRVLEYLAVRKLAPGKKGPILCLAGPPGVGKTSLGKSVARALGREFVRMSLGGVRDEAEVRGHRRTYVGALPGRIIQAMKRAGTRNPVMLLDEIDKLGADFRGDPSSALLEVLDPEQNNTFSDHYLEVPFDLSEVIFIATANDLQTVPGPLLDRMEVIGLPGYTMREKRRIAEHHLIPKQVAEHGLAPEQVRLSESAIEEVIEHYTREGGVRSLERELASIIRGVAMKVAATEGPASGPASETIFEVDKGAVADYLGPARFFSDIAEHTEMPGVATGLAWTPVGGDVLFVEATAMPGQGKLVLTGQLGDVMKESAQAALSWVRTHGGELGLLPQFFERIDIHLHVPQGGTPKDGPSAGVTMISALVSLLTGIRVRSDVAMTGELTLRGAVLPVGGIKEKVLAAHRAGVKQVVLPERNAKDLVDVPEEVKRELTFVFARRIETVLSSVLERPAHKATPEAPPALPVGPETPAPLPVFERVVESPAMPV